MPGVLFPAAAAACCSAIQIKGSSGKVNNVLRNFHKALRV
jgi:hypothetical protein